VSSKKTETRRAILDATVRLLEEEATPLALEDVARAAGVSRQAVYWHFSNKPELLIAAGDHSRTRLGFDEAAATVLAAASADAALEALLQVHVRFAPRLVRVARAIEAERLRDPTIEAAWQAKRARGKHTVRRVLERLAAEGRLDPGWSVDEAAALMGTLLSPATTDELTRRRGWSRPRLLARLREIVQRTLLRAAPSRARRDARYRRPSDHAPPA
jgi:AcrR family transcriptional regulator